MIKKLPTYSWAKQKLINQQKKELIDKLNKGKDLDLLAQKIKDKHEKKIYNLAQRGSKIDWTEPMNEYEDILTGGSKTWGYTIVDGYLQD